MDIGPFAGLLSSLSSINQLHIEIRDESGQVYSSDSKPQETAISHAVESVFQQIMQGTLVNSSFGGDQRHVCGAPLLQAGHLHGAIIAYENGAAPSISAQDLQVLLSKLADVITDKWDSQNEIEEIAEELIQSFEDLHFFTKLATRIKIPVFSSTILLELIEELLDTMRVDLVFVVLPDNPEYDAEVSTEKFNESVPDQKSFSSSLLNAMPMSTYSMEEHFFVVSNSKLQPAYRQLHPDPYRFLAVKVQHQQNFYGWIGLASFNMDEIFRKGELRLLTSIAEQVAIVMTNTALFHDLERFVVNMVKSMVFAIEAKDYYTSGHSERVNKLCMLMSTQLHLEEEEKKALRWASILHDIGKIGIPERILSKPERLTEEEYRIIQEHPEKGYNILKPIEQLADSLPAILHHHERYDGQGYPGRLKGKEIPRLARIIAVADTFDAINSERAYRPKKSVEETMAIIRDVAGSQLDPELVREFEVVYSTRMQII